jgi:phytanoyl-CoA hydroxylase
MHSDRNQQNLKSAMMTMNGEGAHDCDDFMHTFRIDLESPSSDDDQPTPQHLRDQFRRDGFIVFPHVFETSTVDAMNGRLEEILRGRYDRGQRPDKQPKLIKGILKEEGGTVGSLGFSGNLQNVKVLQVINVHKCDSLFREIEISPKLGQVVAELAGWKQGARLAQDQIWAKPPGAAPLVFHRDSPYFMFDPPHVVTVWVALDDMDEELGPLEYVRGSHQWGDGRFGTANQFFQANGGKALLQSAAERAGVTDIDIVSMAGLKAGGLSIHDGLTWHGSGKNTSKTKPRRGLGLHFVPAEIEFTKEASKSRLWRSYVEDIEDSTDVPISDEDFPITWQPSSTTDVC